MYMCFEFFFYNAIDAFTSDAKEDAAANVQPFACLVKK